MYISNYTGYQGVIHSVENEFQIKGYVKSLEEGQLMFIVHGVNFISVGTPVLVKVYHPIEGLLLYKGLLTWEDKKDKKLKIEDLRYERTIQLRKEVRGKLYTILPVKYYYEGEKMVPLKPPVFATAKNLSANGILFTVSGDSLKVGDEIHIDLALESILGIAAKIVRKEFFAENVYAYGCHFPYLTEVEKEKIRTYVYSLQAKERVYWEEIYNKFYAL